MWWHKEEMESRKSNYFKVGEITACLDTEGNNPVMRENVIDHGFTLPLMMVI